jgi:hypothetical protein
LAQALVSLARQELQRNFDLRAIRAHRSVYDGATMYRMDWTDDRLQERFDSIDRRFDAVDRRFEQVNRRFDKVDAELHRVNDRLDGLHRVLMQIGGGIFVALLGLIATQL